MNFTNGLGNYQLSMAPGEGTLVATRHFLRKGYYYQPQHYPVIRQFYEAARRADDTTAVLKGGVAQ